MKQEKRPRHIGPSYEIFIQPTSVMLLSITFDWQAVSKGNLAGFSNSVLILPVIRSWVIACLRRDLADKETHPCLTSNGIHHTSRDIHVIREALKLLFSVGIAAVCTIFVWGNTS